MIFLSNIDDLLHKKSKNTTYIGFRRVNTLLLTTHLAVLETNTRATSRALH